MIPSSYGPFDVFLTQNQREQLALWQRTAIPLGIGANFRADWSAIMEKLATSPREWGDPLYSLHHLQLLMYRGIHARIAVSYVVHDRLPTVFVSGIKPILNHPLAGS
jgi:hypothetical protein